MSGNGTAESAQPSHSRPGVTPDRPDLAGWRRRNEQRRSNAARPIPSGKEYQRKPKHQREQEKRYGQ